MMLKNFLIKQIHLYKELHVLKTIKAHQLSLQS
jgi:hypothetical protein